MSLPSPIDLFKGARSCAKSVLFAVVVLLVVVPIIQVALILGGIVLMVFKHWIIGVLLIVAGLVGRKIGRDLRI